MGAGDRQDDASADGRRASGQGWTHRAEPHARAVFPAAAVRRARNGGHLDVAVYRSISIVDEIGLPAALRADHRTKAGTWGFITVLDGTLQLTRLDPPDSPLLSPGCRGRVKPLHTHFVTPIGAVRMRVNFHDSAPDVVVSTMAGGEET